MILEKSAADEIRNCVGQIRSLSGVPDVDLLLNKRTRRWVVVQRATEAKFPVDPLLIDCLPNPDNPPPRTDCRALFEVKSPRGGYLYPPYHPVTIANMVRELCPRRDEAFKKIEDSKAAVAEAKRKADEEMAREMTEDFAMILSGQKSFVVPDIPTRKKKKPALILPDGG